MTLLIRRLCYISHLTKPERSAGVSADGAQRQTDQEPGRSDELGIVTRRRVGEDITVLAARRKSAWSIVVRNRGNAWGAKGPYCCQVEFSEGGHPLVGAKRTITERRHVELPLAFEVNERGLPEAVFKLRKRLYIKAKRSRSFDAIRCMIGFCGQTCLRRRGTKWLRTTVHLGWMGFGLRTSRTPPEVSSGLWKTCTTT